MSVPKNAYLLALARRRTYKLFGRLYLEGLTADLLPQLEAVPRLAELVEPFDPRAAATAHVRLTTVFVFPYQAIFLDPDGRSGGAVNAQIAALYRQNGYDARGEAGHVGQELRFLSYLCAMEARAHIEGAADTAALWGGRQQAFLTTQLLTWLPPLIAAVELAGDPFYGRLAGLTLELAADHVELRGPGGTPGFLPPAPSLAGLGNQPREIARILLAPPLSGVFLSRAAIGKMAGRRALPGDSGDREELLAALLGGAENHDNAGALLQDMAKLFESWQNAYAGQIERQPRLAPWIRSWQERCTQTDAELRALPSLIKL